MSTFLKSKQTIIFAFRQLKFCDKHEDSYGLNSSFLNLYVKRVED